MIIKATCMFVVISLCTVAWGLTIVTDGSSGYSIFIPDGAIPAERTAAEELSQHVAKMSGAKLPIVGESRFSGGHGIFLGKTRRLEKLGVQPDWEQLGKEGYLLRVADGNLIIAGGRPRGTLYGVYWLLEKYLGCRWFAPDTTVIPKRSTVSLPELDYTGGPVFEYHEAWIWEGGNRRGSRWWADNFSRKDAAYVARTRNSGQRMHWANLGQRYGGSFKMPNYGHNMKSLVPFDKYGDTHPKYYALQKDGRRQTRDEQHVDVCMTNPEVVLAASATMRQWMRDYPDADMFFVGMSDGDNYCKCDKCGALLTDKYAGRLSGPLLEFLNAIARLVEEEFPDKLIGTYAYQITHRPPANLTAHRNVVIYFCPFTRCFRHSLNEGPLNKGAYRYDDTLETWSRIARKVYMYDYHFGMPASDPPSDLLGLAETYRFYRSMGVRGVFVDALPDIQVGYGFLRYWLMTQLMNDADFDFDKGISEFLDAYYGAAAKDIRRFIELVSDPAMYEPATPKRAAVWFPQGSAKWNDLRHNCLVNWRILSVQAVEKAYTLFESARKSVADDPKALQHVLSARMVLQYSMLEYLPADDPRLKDEAVSFLNLLEELGMQSIQKLPLAEYREKISEKLGMKTGN